MAKGVVIPVPLVASMEKLNRQRRALEAQTRKLRDSEYAIKDQIKRMMGRRKTAPVGDTGRIVELVTVNQEKKVIDAYSYTLVTVKDAPK